MDSATILAPKHKQRNKECSANMRQCNNSGTRPLVAHKWPFRWQFHAKWAGKHHFCALKGCSFFSVANSYHSANFIKIWSCALRTWTEATSIASSLKKQTRESRSLLAAAFILTGRLHRLIFLVVSTASKPSNHIRKVLLDNGILFTEQRWPFQSHQTTCRSVGDGLQPLKVFLVQALSKQGGK